MPYIRTVFATKTSSSDMQSPSISQSLSITVLCIPRSGNGTDGLITRSLDSTARKRAAHPMQDARPSSPPSRTPSVSLGGPTEQMSIERGRSSFIAPDTSVSAEPSPKTTATRNGATTWQGNGLVRSPPLPREQHVASSSKALRASQAPRLPYQAARERDRSTAAAAAARRLPAAERGPGEGQRRPPVRCGQPPPVSPGPQLLRRDKAKRAGRGRGRPGAR
mmetsp:Transcript_32137/g.76413  ORF Transcript_32137/g.76413 Transcript_32137/m.76413 type:complete len:221 (-) Transcript_32137:585-1247(-)